MASRTVRWDSVRSGSWSWRYSVARADIERVQLCCGGVMIDLGRLDEIEPCGRGRLMSWVNVRERKLPLNLWEPMVMNEATFPKCYDLAI